MPNEPRPTASHLRALIALAREAGDMVAVVRMTAALRSAEPEPEPQPEPLPRCAGCGHVTAGHDNVTGECGFCPDGEGCAIPALPTYSVSNEAGEVVARDVSDPHAWWEENGRTGDYVVETGEVLAAPLTESQAATLAGRAEVASIDFGRQTVESACCDQLTYLAMAAACRIVGTGHVPNGAHVLGAAAVLGFADVWTDRRWFSEEGREQLDAAGVDVLGALIDAVDAAETRLPDGLATDSNADAGTWTLYNLNQLTGPDRADLVAWWSEQD